MDLNIKNQTIDELKYIVNTKYPNFDCDIRDFDTKNRLKDFIEIISTEKIKQEIFLNCYNDIKQNLHFTADIILEMATMFQENISEITKENLEYYIILISNIYGKNTDSEYKYHNKRTINKILMNNEMIEMLKEIKAKFKTQDKYLETEYYEFIDYLMPVILTRYAISKQINVKNTITDVFENKNNNLCRLLIRQ